MSENSRGDEWRWPMQSSHDSDRVARIGGIPSLYEQDPPPICYPGTPLDASIIIPVPELIRKNLNNIGFHTPDSAQEGGFDSTQGMERDAVLMVASQLGGTPETVDGYFCGGGTEANLEGLYIGRQFLRTFPDPQGKGIAVLCTPLAHYSIFFKGTNILGLTNQFRWEECPKCKGTHKLPQNANTQHLRLVGVNPDGQMNMASLDQVFVQAYEEGYRQFLVVATAGTCLMGSIDPIPEISRWINRTRASSAAEFYFHVDASFGGFTIPFVTKRGECPIGFDVSEVQSVTVDADKMGHLPYPAGIFLCRRGLQNHIHLEVAYIRGHGDCTISGSRTSLAPVLAWEYYHRIGFLGQKEYVTDCLYFRDMLLGLLTNRFGENSNVVRALPRSPFVNFLPLVIDLEKGCVPEKLIEDGILAPYHLRSDGIPQDPMDPFSCPTIAYKICIMPHTFLFLDQFVDDLEKVVRAAGKFGQ